MKYHFNLLFALFVLLTSSIQAETGKNPDFLRGDAIYQKGKGDAAGFPEAIQAFKLAAEQGDAHAQFFLGRMYHFGHGVPVNLELAERWYVSAGEKGDATAWNNLGNIYIAQKKPEEMILKALLRSSEMGEALGSFNVARVSHSGDLGVRKNFTRALDYYQKALAQQPHYPDAWKFIGKLYEEGGFGIKRDLKAAETAYLTGVRESEDKYCYYCLYSLYSRGELPPRDMPAFTYLEKAAERGNDFAACSLATDYLNGWGGVEKDIIKSAYFNDLAAKEGRGCCTYILTLRAKDKDVVEHYGKKTVKSWVERWKALDKSMRKEVADELPKIRTVFAAGDENAACAMMDEAFKRWISRTTDKYQFSCFNEVWSEAQIGGGRENLEWGRFLDTWLSELSEADSAANNILGARSNLNARLFELGRYGLLRDSCTQLKRMILELEGVDVDAALKLVSIAPDFKVIGAENLPLFGDAKVAQRSQRINYEHGISSGDMIGGQAMNAMVDLAGERLSVGDWKSALILSEWDLRWAEKLTAEKKEPERAYPQCLGEQQRLPYALKADVFAALGLPDLEAAACQKIIDMGAQKAVYRSRHFHRAQFKLAGIQVDQGESNKVDLAKLQDTENKMRANKLDDSHAWQLAKLVRARVLAEVQGIDVARPIVSEVLASSAEDGRPLLRLEALLVSADLELKAGNTEGVVRSLEEALSWARGQGLLLSELRTDELYVTYLVKIGDYDQALTMQGRVLELIDALKLSPRRECAILRLAEIHGLRRDDTAALALLKDIKSPSLGDRVKAVEEGVKFNGPTKPTAKPVTMEQVTLQPMGIQSMPLRQEAEAIFMLSNPNPGACDVELTLESEFFGLVLAENSKEEVAIRSGTSQEAGSHRLVAKVEVPGTGHLPVTLSAEGLGSLDRDVTVSLQAMSSACPVVQKSEWQIHTKGNEVAVAVIDAAQLKNSAFCLVPVYHHLDARDEAKKSTSIRVVASEPTRVEGYASDGTLLFVDAQGNGSFRDPGDLIATATVDELFPVLNAGNANGRIALRYRPASRNTNGRVELRIETRAAGEENDWNVDAIDWLER